MRCEAITDAGVPNEQVRRKITPLAPRENAAVWQRDGSYAIVKGELYEVPDEFDLTQKFPSDWPNEGMRGKPRGWAQWFRKADASVHGAKAAQDKPERKK